jgi:hypothetical protein
MPSPFPGMNPYIERPDVLNDFRRSFIPAARESLVPQIHLHYYIRIENHHFTNEVPVHERLPYLEIHDRDRNEVVAVVELLSPANKATGPHRDHYLAKVRRILASRAAFVEIDLLRAGPKMPWADLPECDYYAIVSRHAARANGNPRADLWPLRVRDPLPTIPIPLRPGEAEPTLDIQAILHRIYDAAGYAMFLYRTDPDPPLSSADAVWAAQILNPPAAPT